MAAPKRKKVDKEDELLVALERQLRLTRARDDLIEFTKLTMPDVSDPNGSRYQVAPHHRLIADTLHRVERGEILRLIVTMPPRHGKTELCSRRLVAWFLGRNPEAEVIFVTYGQDLANDVGGKVRDVMVSPTFAQVFPKCEISRDSRAKDKLQTTSDGMAVFVGIDGAITGRGADLAVFDDPIKNRQDAESETIRNAAWEMFTSAVYTRLMPGGRVIIILTRWHEDDIVGRLSDPRYVDQEDNEQWDVLSLPAIAELDDPLGRAPGEALWPCKADGTPKYPVERLDKIRKTLGSRNWTSLYQQKPTPDDGNFFLRDMFKPYRREELPTNLRKYGASDHAISQKQQADLSCMGCVGLDVNDDIWILPDVDWDRMDGDAQVERMLGQMRRNNPQIWWAEKGHISKSIGPFLRKRMLDENVHCYIDEKTPAADKRTRAQAIRARASLRPIRVPAFMPWWDRALDELLKFDNGRHDDFVDWLSWIGLGLEAEYRAGKPKLGAVKGAPPVGSGSWVIWRSRQDEKIIQLRRAGGGM